MKLLGLSPIVPSVLVAMPKEEGLTVSRLLECKKELDANKRSYKGWDIRIYERQGWGAYSGSLSIFAKKGSRCCGMLSGCKDTLPQREKKFKKFLDYLIKDGIHPEPNSY